MIVSLLSSEQYQHSSDDDDGGGDGGNDDDDGDGMSSLAASWFKWLLSMTSIDCTSTSQLALVTRLSRCLATLSCCQATWPSSAAQPWKQSTKLSCSSVVVCLVISHK